MLAERRDFTVATYSSTRGTGARSTVCVFTGRACAADTVASVLVHPELVRMTTARKAIKNMLVRVFKRIILGTSSQPIQMPVAVRKIQYATCRYIITIVLGTLISSF